MSRKGAKPRRAVVLGALSAMAEATCRLLAAEGSHLCLFARDAARLEGVAQDLRARGAASVTVWAGDLSDASDAQDDLRAASEAMGGVDAILIFYGYLGDQSRGETDPVEAARIISTNFSSAAAWALAGAELLEQTGGENAVLLGITSVAADRGRRSNYIYGAAKGGFSILLQGIAHRFAARAGGPRAVAIKAGFVDTPMTAGLKKGGPLWASPEQIAKIVRRAMDGRAAIVYAPWIWRWIMLIIRLLPEPMFNKVNL